MPGLWDMHAHFSKGEGPSYLAGGVTHLRDMGNDNILLTYKKQITDNKLLAPDISYLSGFIDKEDPFQGPTGKMIRSVEEGIKAIDEWRLGPQSKVSKSMLANKARNCFYFLPLILGLIGLFYHYKKDSHDAWVVRLIILISGRTPSVSCAYHKGKVSLSPLVNNIALGAQD